MIGSHLPMMRTSAGRAYLTFCDQTQRDLILAHIRRLGDPADEPFLDPRWLARMMYETRERGLALRDAGEFRAQTASLAAPIMAAGGIVGCVSMIWIAARWARVKPLRPMPHRWSKWLRRLQNP